MTLLLTSVALATAALAARRSMSGDNIDERVERLLRDMTLEEKIDLLGGVDGFYLRGVPRLNVPRMKMSDGPLGVRGGGPATAMAGGIALAATWNPDLAARVGREIGRDARARGVHFLLGPGVNIYVAPVNGRNFEYFGEDPLLAGKIAAGYITGMQREGVSATVKHFLGNNSEFDRHRTDVVVDERTLREIYLPAFEAAVKNADVGAIMTSYNLVNGQHMSQQGGINNDIVKKEWGFRGVIMSDWTSTYDGIAAANGGLDVEMPSGEMMNRAILIPAIKKGQVTETTIDDKVGRILRVAARLGWLDREQTDRSIPQDNPQGRDAALAAAREGMVLLKNDGDLLPVSRSAVRTIAVIGPNAHPAVPVGGGSAAVEAINPVSFRDGIKRVAGEQVKVLHHRGVPPVLELAQRTRFTTDAKGSAVGVTLEGFPNIDLSGRPAMTRLEQHVAIAGRFFSGSDNGKGSSARCTGYFTAEKPGPHRIAVQTTRGDGGFRVRVDDNVVLDNWRLGKPLVTHTTVQLAPGAHRVVLEQFRRAEWGNAATRLGIIPESELVDPAARDLVRQADVVVVAVGFDTESEGEASDRTFALPAGQNELVRLAAEANPKTIVAITSGGGVDMTAWVDRVPAIVQAWYPGQEGGTALAQLLFGDANFSGHLPVTFERRLEDNPSLDSYYPAEGTTRVVYKNGVFVGYRGFQQQHVKPLFPFGHGLSYTAFALSDLHAQNSGAGVTLTFRVKNTGRREGAAVPQVYVSERQPSLPRPPMELKAFEKVTLKAGETKTVTVSLDARAFSYFDVNTHAWRANRGDFDILVGSSSGETPLKVTVRR